MSPHFASDLLARLSAWATAEFGLRFPPDRWSELARGVASAALEQGVADLSGWAELLVEGRLPAEDIAAVASHLTIPETYFFRQREAFQLLEKVILPERLERRRERLRAVRIWSAGCASGEEPYSVAMLVARQFPNLPPEQISIVGTDINARVLGVAERGVYSEWSFRDVPAGTKEAWFTRISPTRFALRADVRSRVRFVRLNLAAPLYPVEFGPKGDFDAILCRNVLMYFSADWQQTLLARLAAALSDDGWLLLGPCDVSLEQATRLGLRPVAPGIFQRLAPLGAATELPGTLAGWTLAPQVVPDTLPPGLGALSAGEAPPTATMPSVDEVVSAGALPEPMSEDDVELAPAERAFACANRGQLDAALEACEQALSADNTRCDLHFLRGCILSELGRDEAAAEAYRRVLFLEPDSVVAEFFLGGLARRAGRRREARRHFTEVISQLAGARAGGLVPGSDGLTVARLRELARENVEALE